MSKAAAASTSRPVRLHLSPFTPALFQSLLLKSQQTLVTSVSYHSTQNEPGKGFGYLELPADEAEKLRKKLNGATLRGHKMTVEKARPEKRKALHEYDESTVVKTLKTKKCKTKNPKHEIAGVELPADRKVKRGWTDAAAKRGDNKKRPGAIREKSRYTDKDELLFRVGGVKSKSRNPTDEGEKKDKKDNTKTSKSGKDIIHEFETTSKFPSFLKQEQAKRTDGPLTFVDGEGWVDEEGNMVEAVRSSRRAPTLTPVPAPGLTTFETSKSADGPKVDKPDSDAVSESSTSLDASGMSSDTDSDSEISLDSDSDLLPDSDSDTASSTSAASLTSTPNPATAFVTPPAEDGVEASHLLEALYKRRPTETPRLAVQTNFSFFGNDDCVPSDDDDDDDAKGHPAVPATAITATDLRMRTLRSAAPTPDTAHPFSMRFGEEGDREETGEAEEEESGGGRKVRSAMVDEFYARRSELNASWRTRRREATKALRAKGRR